jgi:uncharacterized protein (TIGR01777 family)
MTTTIRHRMTPIPPPSPFTVALTGSTGLIGSAAVRVFEQRGLRVLRLVRRAANGDREIAWNPSAGSVDAAKLEGVDAVINLAGANIAQRWTEHAKLAIRESRINGTTALCRALAGMSNKPRVLLSGSAIGIYGAQRSDPLDESSSLGDDFLASVARDWEEATESASAAGIRVVHLRTGIVLSRDGGMLERLLLPFKLGIGGRLGDGRQWLSWIALADYVEALSFLLTADSVAGPVNIVAPNPVTNAEFTRALGRVLRRPAVFPVPRIAMSLAFGEMAEDTIFADQRVRPRRLLEAGFAFALPALEAALRQELTASPRERSFRRYAPQDDFKRSAR